MVNFVLCECYLKKKKSPSVEVKDFHSLEELIRAYSTERDKNGGENKTHIYYLIVPLVRSPDTVSAQGHQAKHRVFSPGCNFI